MRVRTGFNHSTGRIGYSMGFGISTRGLHSTSGNINSHDSGDEKSRDNHQQGRHATHVGSLTNRKTIVLSTGTFDPIHAAHVKSIEMMRKEFGVDQVVVSAVFDPVHKAGRGLKDTHHHRTKMVQIAVEHIEHVHVDPVPFVSTYHALARLRSSHPYHTRIFLIGMDLLESFPTWHGGPERYLRHAHILVVPRPGYTIPNTAEVQAVLKKYGAKSLDELRQVESGRILLWEQSPKDADKEDISSTAVRKIYVERGMHHHSLSKLLPPKVLKYIAEQNLYQVSKPAKHAPTSANAGVMVAPRARLFDQFARLVMEQERNRIMLAADSESSKPSRK